MIGGWGMLDGDVGGLAMGRERVEDGEARATKARVEKG